MPPQFGLVLPLWDYADRPEWLDRVAGEIGLDHLTVPVVSGPVESFRLARAIPPDSAAAPYFATEGGWHFPPNAKSYSSTGVRPTKARWFGAADVLGRLAEHLARLGVRLVARVELRDVSALLHAEEHLAQRNAWGQPILTAGL
jgi:hypothetical protein